MCGGMFVRVWIQFGDRQVRKMVVGPRALSHVEASWTLSLEESIATTPHSHRGLLAFSPITELITTMSETEMMG